MKPEWIKPSTAAKRLNRTRQAIYNRIYQGDLRTKDMDGTTYVDWNQVKTLVFREPNKSKIPKVNLTQPKKPNECIEAL